MHNTQPNKYRLTQHFIVKRTLLSSSENFSTLRVFPLCVALFSLTAALPSQLRFIADLYLARDQWSVLSFQSLSS